MVRNIVQEVTAGIRRLSAAWRLAIVCIAFLGVAIGLTTTVFSFVNGALLRPLPYPESDRLVAITEDDGQLPRSRILVTERTLAALRRDTRAFASVSAYEDRTVVVAVGEHVRTLFVTAIDSSVLRTLRVRPQFGVVPTASEHASGARVALVSDALWRAQFGGARDVIGRPVRLNDTTYHVVGVMPRDFAFSLHADLWIPLQEPVHSAPQPEQQRWFSVIARLNPGVTHAQARQELSIIEARLRQDEPSYWRRMRVVMRDDAVFRVAREWKSVLLLFLAGVGAVVVIACVNVGTLLSMRTTERRAAIAVRAALGANRLHLVAHTVVESVLLVIAGAVLGLVLSVALVPVVERVAVLQYMPKWFSTDLDYRVFLFTAGLAGLAVVLTSIRAASHSMRLDVVQTLRRGADGGSTSRDVSRAGIRGVVVQVAVTVMIAVASALLAVTYHRVTSVDPGYARDRMAAVHVFIDRRHVPTQEHHWERLRELAKSLAASGGVEAATLRGELVGYRSAAPTQALKDGDVHSDLSGRRAEHPGWIAAQKTVVDPNYFSTLQIPVLRGRTFHAAESNATTAVVLSATAAEMLWPQQEPVGRLMRIGSNGPPLTVIGVVGDIRLPGVGLNGMGVWPIASLYLSSAQAEGTTPVVHARFTGDPDVLRATSGAEVLRVLGPRPFFIETPEMAPGQFVVLLRTSGALLGSSAVIACLLAAFGAYAVVRFRGQQQQRNISIRMALGATQAQIRAGVARDCVLHGAVGVLVGLLGSAFIAEVLRAVIWGVSPFSPVLYGAVALLVIVLIGTASLVASDQASKVDPASAMRT